MVREGPVFHKSGPLTNKIATLKVKTDLNLQNKIWRLRLTLTFRNLTNQTLWLWVRLTFRMILRIITLKSEIQSPYNLITSSISDHACLLTTGTYKELIIDVLFTDSYGYITSCSLTCFLLMALRFSEHHYSDSRSVLSPHSPDHRPQRPLRTTPSPYSRPYWTYSWPATSSHRVPIYSPHPSSPTTFLPPSHPSSSGHYFYWPHHGSHIWKASRTPSFATYTDLHEHRVLLTTLTNL